MWTVDEAEAMADEWGFNCGPAALSAVTGRWDVATNVFGKISQTMLTIAEQDGALTATLEDEDGGEIEVTAISFEDGILSYEFVAPKSLRWLAGSKKTDGEGSKAIRTLVTWLQVREDTFNGALSGGIESELDLPISGQRKGPTPDAD